MTPAIFGPQDHEHKTSQDNPDVLVEMKAGIKAWNKKSHFSYILIL
jgi:hypothetical protein